MTARIVTELEAGRLPWVQPWDSAIASPSLPRNAVTGRAYSGVNVLILWGEVIAKGYANQGWLTFRQALAAGGCVRKGEQGVTVCYADRFTPEAEKERARADGDEAKAVPFLKRFVVFNVAQCDGLPDEYFTDAPPLPEREQVPVAESLIAATGADFSIGGARAFCLLFPVLRFHSGAAATGVPPADRLLSHRAARTRPLDRPRLAAGADLWRTVR